MKRLLRSFAIYYFTLWLTATYFGGIDYGKNFQVLALGAIALTVSESTLKPLINLLLLPFNLVTLGVFRWISGVLTLYVATALVPGFQIVPFVYQGFQSNLFIIPQIHFSVFTAYIVLSFLISTLGSFLFWLSR